MFFDREVHLYHTRFNFTEMELVNLDDVRTGAYIPLTVGPTLPVRSVSHSEL